MASGAEGGVPSEPENEGSRDLFERVENFEDLLEKYQKAADQSARDKQEEVWLELKAARPKLGVKYKESIDLTVSSLLKKGRLESDQVDDFKLMLLNALLGYEQIVAERTREAEKEAEKKAREAEKAEEIKTEAWEENERRDAEANAKKADQEAKKKEADEAKQKRLDNYDALKGALIDLSDTRKFPLPKVTDVEGQRITLITYLTQAKAWQKQYELVGELFKKDLPTDSDQAGVEQEINDAKKSFQDLELQKDELVQASNCVFQDRKKHGDTVHQYYKPAVKKLVHDLKEYETHSDSVIKNHYYKTTLSKDAALHKEVEAELAPLSSAPNGTPEGEIRQYLEGLLQYTAVLNVPEPTGEFNKSISGAVSVDEFFDACFNGSFNYEQVKNSLEGKYELLKNDAVVEYQEKIDNFRSYLNDINSGRLSATPAEKAAVRNALQKAEAAKVDMLDYLDAMHDMVVEGNFHRDEVDAAKGRDKNRKMARRIAGEKEGKAGVENYEPDAEKANRKFNKCKLFNTADNLDWITQDTKVGAAAEVGVLQKAIAIIYRDHLDNVSSKFHANKLLDTTGDAGSMDDVLNVALGKDLKDFMSKTDPGNPTASPPRLPGTLAAQAGYQELRQALRYHSDSMFKSFRQSIKFKIARDDLSELASMHAGVTDDMSLPGGVERYSFGNIAYTPVKISRSSPQEQTGFTVLANTPFDFSEVFKESKPRPGESKRRDGTNLITNPNDPRYTGSQEDYPRYLSKLERYQALREEVYARQMKELKKGFRTKLAHWYQGGIPPAAYAMNGGDNDPSLKQWLSAEDAMQKIQSLAVIQETKYNHDWDDKVNHHKLDMLDLNTQMSKIQAFTGLARRADLQGTTPADAARKAVRWWDDRNTRLSQGPQGLEAVDINAMSIYLDIITHEIIGSPFVIRREGAEAELYENEILANIDAMKKAVGAGKQLPAAVYLPVVEKYLADNDKQHPGLKYRHNNFMIKKQNFRQGAELDYLRRNYNIQWLLEHGYTREAAKKKVTTTRSLLGALIFGPSNDPLDNLATSMSKPDYLVGIKDEKNAFA
jgi:hypothetical protein